MFQLFQQVADFMSGNKMFAEGGNASGFDVDTVFQHYIIAALWSSVETDADDEDISAPLDATHSFSDLDADNAVIVKAAVAKFLSENAADLKASGLSDEQIGHDLWLTQVGHGAGFWDRGLDKDLGNRLSLAARKLGSSAEIYVNENDKVVVEGIKYAEGGNLEEDRFNYMMLSRLQSDCEYFLGYGKMNESVLWADSIDAHIAEMKRLWNLLPVKPEWLSMEQILDYENQMKGLLSDGGGVKGEWLNNNPSAEDINNASEASLKKWLSKNWGYRGVDGNGITKNPDNRTLENLRKEVAAQAAHNNSIFADGGSTGVGYAKHKYKAGEPVVIDGDKGVIESLDYSIVDSNRIPSYWVKFDLSVHPDGYARNIWESTIDKGSML